MVARLTFAAWLATGSVASAQEPCIPEEVRERVSCPAESDAAPEGASSGAVDEEVRQVMAALDQAASSAARDASGQVVRSRVHGGELDVTPRPLTPGEGGLVGAEQPRAGGEGGHPPHVPRPRPRPVQGDQDPGRHEAGSGVEAAVAT